MPNFTLMFVSGPMSTKFIIIFVSGPIVSGPMFNKFMLMFVSGPIVSGPIHRESFLVAITSHAHWSPASVSKTKCDIHDGAKTVAPAAHVNTNVNTNETA